MPALMYQSWRDLLFLHWEVPVELIQQKLSAGLEVETFDGVAYLALVPFFMNRVRPRLFPPVPGISWFLELNVRTYVRSESGQSGVWFFSLDCNQALAVTLAQTFFRLPYEHAEMTATKEHDWIRYSCRREGQCETSRFRYRGAGELRVAPSGSLEEFLLERYHLLSPRTDGGYYCGEVRHSPYEFCEAELTCFDTLPMQWGGFEIMGEPCSALYSPGPNVSIHPLVRL